MELRGQSIYTEDQNEKIEGIQRPAQKTREERIPLDGRQPAKMCDEFHVFARGIVGIELLAFCACPFCVGQRMLA